MSTFDIPYEFSLHESPVTFTDYYGHCPSSLMEDLYAIGSKYRKTISEVCFVLCLPCFLPVVQININFSWKPILGVAYKWGNIGRQCGHQSR